MLKSMLTAILLTTGLTVFAHDGHTDNPHDPNHTPSVCSPSADSVCAHLKFLTAINSSTAGEFIVHVTTPSETAISDLKVKLWMDMGGHGHGSAPVEIATMDEANHFKITNAWFVMAGPWLVQIEFIVNGQSHTVAIPIMVTE